MEGVKCGVQLREALRVEVRDLARAQADGVTSGLSKVGTDAVEAFSR